ncbi:unnamed protein product [Phytophthora lilii]|uniref:Unnamed protein product n=1 Tax=Phytophthora lilii TaxID=2077276 RepID=A0A9W6TW26_9STRA|nr:unnamed protein product [Phytophthora lilii]
MIVLSYVDDYDADLTGFSFELIDDDNWFAQMLDEARLVLVTSWSDLFAHVVYSLGVVATTANMKELLRWAPTQGTRIHHAKGPSRDELQHLSSVGPGNTSQNTRHDEVEMSGSYRCLVPRHFCDNEFITTVVKCNPKVKPMAGARSACFAVEFDCYKVGISGKKEEVEAEWGKFDHTTVVKLHILHSPGLEMPKMIQEFAHLHEIRVYNSTIREWDQDATIKNSFHPNLTVLALIRSNMTNGLVPPGFQSNDFPVNLTHTFA